LELSQQLNTTPTCCIPTCVHQENSQFRFFRFLSYENTLIQWLVNTQMKPSLVSTSFALFQFYFEPKAVQETQLLRSAVPTLFLGNEEYLIPKYIEEEYLIPKYIEIHLGTLLLCTKLLSEQGRRCPSI